MFPTPSVWFSLQSIVSLYAPDYDSDYDSVASENQPLIYRLYATVKF